MSKQHRPPSHKEAQASSGADREAEAQNEQLLGNQAVAQQVTGVEAAVDSEKTVIDEARTLVERGFFALYAEPRPQTQVDKWVRVLEGSRLPTERKASLVEKLTGDQEAATAATEAVERWFGGPELAGHESGLEALDAVWTGLSGEVAAEGHSSESLLEELAGDRAEAVVGFCREVYLILGFQEEEEEEEDVGGEVPPELA